MTTTSSFRSAFATLASPVAVWLPVSTLLMSTSPGLGCTGILTATSRCRHSRQLCDNRIRLRGERERFLGQAIGDFLPSAVGVAISPLPIVAVVLMLVTPRGRVNGPSFVGGWIVGLVVVGAIVLAIAGGASASTTTGPATWVDVLFLVLGVLLILVAGRQWRGRP